MRSLIILFVASTVLGVRTQDRPAPGTGDLQIVSPEIAAFVSAALEDRLAVGDVADLGLVREGGQWPVPLTADMRVSRALLPPSAVPLIPSFPLHLVRSAEIQQAADRSGKSVAYLFVDRPTIEGDAGSLTIGVDIALPSTSKMIKMCCCSGTAQFVKNGAQWRFLKWTHQLCS